MSWLAALRARRAYLLLALVVFAADQLTKVLAHRHLRGRGPLELIPDFFNLWYTRNAGGLFGYFRDLADPWRWALLTLLPMLAIGLVFFFLVRGEAADRPTLLGLALILGGATGNLVDRVFRGEVVDFLDVYAPPSRLAEWLVSWFGTARWPTFNLADSSIVVGACLLALHVVRARDAAPAPEGGRSSAGRASQKEPV